MATAEEDDIAARFAAIVSPLEATMDWDSDVPVHDEPTPDQQAKQAAEAAHERQVREARREQRRRERADEVAEFEAAKAELAAEYSADYHSADGHFSPPEPPPLPTIRRGTIAAVLLLVGGVTLIGLPGLLLIDPQVTMVVGLMMIAGGALILLSRLRRTDEHPPDNGAVL